MSADEFWKDDPQLFVSYRTSFFKKKEHQVEEEDYKSWLQGLYIYNGNGLLFSSLKQFIGNIVASFGKGGRKDNTKLGNYPDKPYMVQRKEEKDKKEQEKIKKENRYNDFQKDLVYFGTLKKQFEEKILKKGE